MSEKRILYSECIRIYEVEEAFIDSLCELGLIRVSDADNRRFVEYDELEELEQFVRWHNDMDINVEGIEALYHMLSRVKTLQIEIENLRNELQFYRSL
ncbi:MAG: chaperone modulator CbpM [Bacteroidia bacterium]|nr:chaperone modulator CbpM [Bacteroidia bacterium]